MAHRHHYGFRRLRYAMLAPHDLRERHSAPHLGLLQLLCILGEVQSARFVCEEAGRPRIQLLPRELVQPDLELACCGERNSRCPRFHQQAGQVRPRPSPLSKPGPAASVHAVCAGPMTAMSVKELNLCSWSPGQAWHAYCLFEGKASYFESAFSLCERISVILLCWCGQLKGHGHGRSKVDEGVRGLYKLSVLSLDLYFNLQLGLEVHSWICPVNTCLFCLVTVTYFHCKRRL